MTDQVLQVGTGDKALSRKATTTTSHLADLILDLLMCLPMTFFWSTEAHAAGSNIDFTRGLVNSTVPAS